MKNLLLISLNILCASCLTFAKTSAQDSKVLGIIPWSGDLDYTKSSKFPTFKKDSAKNVMDKLTAYKLNQRTFLPMGSRQPWEMIYEELLGKDEFSWILDWNSDVQNNIFGSILFLIKEPEDIDFRIELNSAFNGEQGPDKHGPLLISTRLLRELKKNSPTDEAFRSTVKFFVAHEVAHYIYDWYITVISKNYVSLNGGLAIDPVPQARKIYLATPAIANMKDSVWVRRSSINHAEVDWIALEIMTRMGQSMTWTEYKSVINIFYQSLFESKSNEEKMEDLKDKDYLNSIEIRLRTIANSWAWK